MRNERWMKQLRALGLGALGLAMAGSAGAVTITFDDLVHGEIVSDQYDGVAISAVNLHRTFDLAVAFDTSSPSGPDPDLTSVMGGNTTWSGGNLQGTDLGRALIIQENDLGCGDGICDRPDDEGTDAPGQLIFDFDVSVLSFGFDIIDFDDEIGLGSVVFFGNGSSVEVAYADFLSAAGRGNNFAHRIDPFTAAGLNLGSIDRVVFNIPGSGAIDNITYQPVPEPSTAGLIGLGLLGLAASSRRHRA